MLLTDVKGVGKATLAKLNSLGIGNLTQLLNYLPKSYCDFRCPVPLSKAEEGQFSLLKIYVTKVSGVARAKSGLNFFSAEAVDYDDRESALFIKNKLKLIWYNQPYLVSSVKEGESYLCYGKLGSDGRRPTIANPSLDSIESPKKLTGIMPVYRLKGAIGQAAFRTLISGAQKAFTPIPIINDDTREKRGLIPLKEAYEQAHCPSDLFAADEAQRRIALEDTVKEIVYYKIFNRTAKNARVFKYELPPSSVDDVISALSYKLTASQQNALEEIFDTLHSGVKMNRILIGDVGSGKTVIALITMLYATKCGYQAAILAPTEILAEQHYRTACALFKDLGVKVAFLSSSIKGEERKRVLKEIADGDAQIIVGTHSIFQKGVTFKKLSLCVIDEQHKFGVQQKFSMENKGEGVDTLTLTATPIPRSFLMLLYDELQLCQIEKHNTGRVSTRLVTDAKRQDMFEYIREQAREGNQAFIVCPSIWDAEGLEMYSATTLFKELSDGIFKDIRVELIHGKMKAELKNEIMRRFAAGEIDALVSTTVIEVGIDIANATTIAVLNSERFGLATLHQLRGRVGRGDKPAFCFLHTVDFQNPRLRALTECEDGLSLAELDFKLRGGGDYLGVRQSGDIGQAKYTVPVTPDMIITARDIAVNDLLTGEITLSAEEYNSYKEKFSGITVN